MEKIILLRLYGLQKSTILEGLSKVLHVKDLDEYIEEKMNLSVSAIFEQRGRNLF
jgi:shikimate kinase